jgi:acyl-CoA thioester hydrolase
LKGSGKIYILLKPYIVYCHQSEIRVRYAETDQMGFVYYGAYAAYFEVGRVEALRNLGITYKSMEDSGILMPVVQYSVKYIKPARYDDLLMLDTCITQYQGARIRFDYQIKNQAMELLNEAFTELVFLSAENMKPVKSPEILRESLKPFFT